MIKKIIMKHYHLIKPVEVIMKLVFSQAFRVFAVQGMIGPCHKQFKEHPGQQKIRTNAFKEAVRRQALKLRNKNERITSSIDENYWKVI